MPLEDVRRLVIRALFSDARLNQELVLKGGNALELVHRVVKRGSIDIDLSISSVFADPDNTGHRINKALEEEFSKAGFTIFDFEFHVLPMGLTEDATPWWGGYGAQFKFISKQRVADLDGDLGGMQREAHPVDDRQGRVFKVDISKHEFCDGKVQHSLDGQVIFVYSLEMCVLEKFRAICQQMPEYAPTEGINKRSRARDFYDIYSAVTRGGLDLALTENQALCRAIFAAKRVPLALLGRIPEHREYHRRDWEAVRATAGRDVLEFDFYFDFVIEESLKLEALWNE